jgi:putative chitinase
MIKADVIRALAPKCPKPEEWAEALSKAAAEFCVDTPARIAPFLANWCHETAGFTRVEENLNYSAQRLMAVWPKRFPNIGVANAYARNPEALANYVYANRMGNGDEKSGDGWRFKGRGAPMLTGRTNYTLYAGLLGLPLVEHPELAKEIAVSARLAGAYWKKNGLNPRADAGDHEGIRKAINGGLLGFEEIKHLTDVAAGLL